MVALCLAFFVFNIAGCGAKKQTQGQENTAGTSTAAEPTAVKSLPQPTQLPVRYQTPGYITAKEKGDDNLGDVAGGYQIKVGATIRSTSGPQPLWDVMKRLVNLKGMTVSWASDVDQNTLVDVDVSANDDFYEAIANLLRQADYFHEINGKNIVVRNKATKVFQISIPSMQGAYTTTVGGNFLANKDVASGTEGTVKIASADNKFNVWDNIESNLKVIIKTAEEERKDIAKNSNASPSGGSKSNEPVSGNDKNIGDKSNSDNSDMSGAISKASKFTAKDAASFIIDKSIGLVTVTAKPSILKTVENYFDNLKKHLYQQVNLEAKIIEVYLQDNSKVGLDWSSVLKNKPINGTVYFGNNGQVHPRVNTNPSNFSNTFVSRVEIPAIDFQVLLNALNEQGDTHVLANPKITVINGQPAIISVGKDIAYVKSIKRDEKTSEGVTTVTFSTEVGNVVQGIALGVMATVFDGKRVTLHLTPITTDIENIDPETGGVRLQTIGEGAIQLGLPQVRAREMSTMVEVQDGEMLIIGGLIDSIETKAGKFAPGLGSIPGLRYLFGVEEKTMQKRELVILLTPKII